MPLVGSGLTLSIGPKSASTPGVRPLQPRAGAQPAPAAALVPAGVQVDSTGAPVPRGAPAPVPAPGPQPPKAVASGARLRPAPGTTADAPIKVKKLGDGLRVASLGPRQGPTPSGPAARASAPRAAVAPPAPAAVAVGALEEKVATTMTSIQSQRAAELRALRDGMAPAAIPTHAALNEDFSSNPNTFVMSAYEASFDAEFVLKMARIGAREGFGVTLVGPPAELERVQRTARAAKLDNLELVPAHDGSPWTEDYLHFAADGAVVVPAVLPYSSLELGAIQLEARVQRAQPGAELPPIASEQDYVRVARAHPDHDYTLQGAVSRDGAQHIAVALAVQTGKPVRMGLTYLEGGNVLAGARPDGTPFALVGADTAALNRALLGRELGEEVDEAFVREALARDLGVAAKDVLVVEQPGEFHLDMSLALWEPGVVLLNDSRAAMAAQLAAERNSIDDKAIIEKASAFAQRRARGEDETAAQLEAMGFRVVRVPGRYVELRDPEVEVANFLNGEGGANEAGARFFITTSGPAWAEQAFLGALGAATTAPVSMYFGPAEGATRSALGMFGSLSCSAKRM